MELLQICKEMTSLQDNACSARGVIFFRGLKFFFLYLGLAIFVVFFDKIFLDLSGNSPINTLQADRFKDMFTHNLLRGFLVVSFIAPLLEECIFRLPLSFKRKHISISIFVAVFFVLTAVFQNGLGSPYKPIIAYGFSNLFDSPFFVGIAYKLPISIVLAVSGFFIKEDFLLKIRASVGRYIIILSVLVFAAFHMTNYQFDFKIVIPLLLLCLPQFVLGTTVSYYRIKLGFGYALAFHCIYNFLTCFFSFLGEIINVLAS